MISPVDIQVTEYSCHCPTRSQAFPPELGCLVGVDEPTDAATFHWEIGTGWVPCVTDEPAYLALQHLAIEMGVDHTPFEDYRAATAAAAVELNRLPLEHWQAAYRARLAKVAAGKAHLVTRAESMLTHAKSFHRYAECRLAVAQLNDLEVAAVAYRILDSGWSGSLEDLLTAAREVLA